MPRKIFLFLFLALAILLGTALPATAAVPRELIVLIADEPTSPTPEAVVAAANGRRPMPAGLHLGTPTGGRLLIPELDRDRLDTSEEALQLLRYVVLEYEDGTDAEAMHDTLIENVHVLWIDYNWPVEVSATPNDPLFPVVPVHTDYQWGLHSLKLPGAWDYNKGHAYVGVVDTGLATTHQDLETYREDGGGNLIALGPYRRQYSTDYGYPEESCDAPICSTSLGCVDEAQPQFHDEACRVPGRGTGHGTHVSGIVAGASNNSYGVSGACWNCSLIFSKASRLEDVTGHLYTNGGIEMDTAIAGIYGAVDKGAQVLNLSLGFRHGTLGDCESGLSCVGNSTNPLCVVVKYAYQRDTVIVAAAGNDYSCNVDFPASDPRVVGVAGITFEETFWNDCPGSVPGDECGGSNYSPDMVWAPAKGILSTFYDGIPHMPSPLSTCHGASELGLCTGTSMAAPHIAGGAGILRSVNPLLAVDDVKFLLQSNIHSALPVALPYYGYGKPHMENAVKAALGTAAGAVLPNRLTPLFSFYSSSREDHLYTTVPQMAMAALFANPPYLPVGSGVPGYDAFPSSGCLVGGFCSETPSASVYIFTGDRAPFVGAPALVPLYRLTYRGTNGNANADHVDSAYTTELAGIELFRDWEYELDGIEGYIYQKCTPEPACMPPGTVKLYRRYHPLRGDFAIFPQSELTTMNGAGYGTVTELAEVMGYVYPNTDGDSDDLIDGFERLAGTGLAVADSDCDGVNDGAEVLEFGSTGYRDPLTAYGCEPPLVSQFVSQTVTASMSANRVYDVTVRFRNVGSQRWNPSPSSCGEVRLGWAPAGAATFTTARARPSTGVDPGEVAVFSFQVTAPAAAGTYDFRWKMLKECDTWFGPTSTNVSIVVAAAAARDTQVLSQTFPTEVRAGFTYPVSIKLRNVGSSDWNLVGPTCNAFRLGSANPGDNLTWGAGRHELPATVASRGEVTVVFNVTAPAVPGTYNFQRRMLQECVTWFGDSTPNLAVTVSP